MSESFSLKVQSPKTLPIFLKARKIQKQIELSLNLPNNERKTYICPRAGMGLGVTYDFFDYWENSVQRFCSFFRSFLEPN